jgi:hypothetical protein
VGRLRDLPPGDRVVLMSDRPLSRWTLRRTARRAGLSIERELVAIPSTRRPRVVLDDSPAAVRHLWTRVAVVPPGVAALAGGAELLLRAMRSAPPSWTGALAPGRLVVGRRDTSPSREESRTPVQGLGAGLLMCASRDPDAKVAFVATGDAPCSRLVVKMGLTDAADAAVEREGRVLAAVRLRGLGSLAGTVPRYVGSPRDQGRLTLVSTAVPGTPMTCRYHAWRHTARPAEVARDLAAAGRWLAELHRTTARENRPLTWADEMAAALAARWDGDEALPAALVRVEHARAALSGTTVPLTAVHGDFWFGNLMVDGDDVVGVVDWELGNEKGCPLRDLARFVLAYSLYLDRHTRPGRRVRGHRGLVRTGPAPGVRHALTDAGWYPDLVREFLGDELERLGIPRGLWYDVALVGLAEVAATANDDEFGHEHLRLLGQLPVRARRHRRTRP